MALVPYVTAHTKRLRFGDFLAEIQRNESLSNSSNEATPYVASDARFVKFPQQNKTADRVVVKVLIFHPVRSTSAGTCHGVSSLFTAVQWARSLARRCGVHTCCSERLSIVIVLTSDCTYLHP